MDPLASLTRNTVKFLTTAGIGASLLVMSGLLMTGTVIALVTATPVLVIFSPILVPAGIVVLLAVAGLVVSGGFGIAAVSALAWMYNYVARKHPIGADQLDSASMTLAWKVRDVKEKARMTLARKARDVKEKAKDYGHYVNFQPDRVVVTRDVGHGTIRRVVYYLYGLILYLIILVLDSVVFISLCISLVVTLVGMPWLGGT